MRYEKTVTNQLGTKVYNSLSKRMCERGRGVRGSGAETVNPPRRRAATVASQAGLSGDQCSAMGISVIAAAFVWQAAGSEAVRT